MSMVVSIASAVEIDGIEYILDSTTKTAAVASQYYSDSYTFRNYAGDIIIPESVTYNETIYNVTEIGYNAFAFSDITSITIGLNVTSIGIGAFYDCLDLASIMVEEDNPIYDSRDNCNAIIETATNSLIYGFRSTIIPNSVISIGNNAFDSCMGLTSIEIPNSVETIGEDAFYNCADLSSITIGNSVTEIGGYAFQNCSNLTSVVFNAKNCESCVGPIFPSIKNLTIGEEVENIPSEAFVMCTDLTSVTIGNSVTRIGESAFFGCTGLTSIEMRFRENKMYFSLVV